MSLSYELGRLTALFMFNVLPYIISGIIGFKIYRLIKTGRKEKNETMEPV